MTEKQNNIGFVYAKDKRCKVLTMDSTSDEHEKLTGSGYKLNASVRMSTVLERILNKADSVQDQLDTMRGRG